MCFSKEKINLTFCLNFEPDVPRLTTGGVLVSRDSDKQRKRRKPPSGNFYSSWVFQGSKWSEEIQLFQKSRNTSMRWGQKMCNKLKTCTILIVQKWQVYLIFYICIFRCEMSIYFISIFCGLVFSILTKVLSPFEQCSTSKGSFSVCVLCSLLYMIEFVYSKLWTPGQWYQNLPPGSTPICELSQTLILPQIPVYTIISPTR